MKKTTLATNVTYINALTRAANEGIHVVGKGVMGGEHGAPAREFFIVNSANPEHEGLYYKVTQRGNTLVCSCKAAQEGVYCKHRAVVTAHIIAVMSAACDDYKATTATA